MLCGFVKLADISCQKCLRTFPWPKGQFEWIFRDKRLKALGKRSDVWAEWELDAAEIVSAHQISMCSYTASLETVCLLLSMHCMEVMGSIFMGRQLRCMLISFSSLFFSSIEETVS